MATEAEYKRALAYLKRQSPRVAKYFDNIKPHVEVFQYAMNAAGITTHDFKTNQIVESMNGIFVDARRDSLPSLCQNSQMDGYAARSSSEEHHQMD